MDADEVDARWGFPSGTFARLQRRAAQEESHLPLLWFVRTAGRRPRFGLWHQRRADGAAFFALDLGWHRLGCWYKRPAAEVPS